MQFSEDEFSKLHRHIGQRVKHARESKGISQLALSLEMGYSSVSLVSAAELYTNRKHFNIEHLYKISKILDTDIKYFFEGI